MDIFVNGIKLHYEKTGSGAPLILLHGNGESHEIFDEAIPLLAPHFTVYAVTARRSPAYCLRSVRTPPHTDAEFHTKTGDATASPVSIWWGQQGSNL